VRGRSAAISSRSAATAEPGGAILPVQLSAVTVELIYSAQCGWLRSSRRHDVTKKDVASRIVLGAWNGRKRRICPIRRYKTWVQRSRTVNWGRGNRRTCPEAALAPALSRPGARKFWRVFISVADPLGSHTRGGCRLEGKADSAATFGKRDESGAQKSKPSRPVRGPRASV